MVANFQPTNTEEWIRQRTKEIVQLQRKGQSSDLVNSGSMLIGMLDPAYRGEGPALVTFEGFPTISTNRFEWLTPYRPTGSRMVSLLRAGGTWKIMSQMSPNRQALALASNWLSYNERNVVVDWKQRAEVDLLPSGIVVLAGLVNSRTTPATDELIATLPVGMRPDYDWLVGVNQSDVARLLVIKPNGEVRAFGSGWTNGFVSLDGIAFPAAGVADWMNIGDAAQPWINTWGPYQSATYGPPRTWLDPYGFVWSAGCVQGGSFTDGTLIFQLPPDRYPYAQHHMQTASGGGYGMIGHNSSPFNRITAKGGNTGAFISLCGAVWPTPTGRSGNPWHDVQYYANLWQRYSPTEFTIPSMLRRGDGLCMANGFISAGTLGAQAFLLEPEVAIPAGRSALMAAGANSARARLDLRTELLAPQQGSNAWFSLDSKVWMSGG